MSLSRKLRALRRWFVRNPNLRTATYMSRHKWARNLATLTQPLWLTPKRFRDMRPLRRWGYVGGCLLFSAGVWTEATYRMHPSLKAMIASSVGEIGLASGLIHSAAIISRLDVITYALATFVTGGLIIFIAATDYWAVTFSRVAAEMIRRQGPFNPGFPYFLLIRSGSIAGIFAVFGILMVVISPGSMAAMEGSPILSFFVFALLVAGGGGVSVRYFLAERERDQQIYGTGFNAAVLRLAGVVGILLMMGGVVSFASLLRMI